jgi:hypothetical protein
MTTAIAAAIMFVTTIERATETLRAVGRDDLARQLDSSGEFGRAAVIRLRGVERQLREGKR